MNEEYVNPYFNGLTSGLTAGQSFGAPKNNFQMSGGNVLGAAGSGAMAGFQSGGPIGAGVGAVVGAVGSVFKQDKALKEATNNVNTNFDSQVDMYGRPTFNGSQYAQGFQDLQGLKEATQPGKHALLPGRRKQMMNKAQQLYSAIKQGQQGYNQSEGQFRQQAIANQEYQERLNRGRNLYQY